MRKLLTILFSFLFGIALDSGCVHPAKGKEAPSEVWVTVEPGAGRTLEFFEGPLTHITLEFPPGSVTIATPLHLSIPSLTEPVFHKARLELVTPVLSLEPLNLRFEKEVRLKLRWLGDPLDEKGMKSLYGFRSLTVEAIGEGQWTTTATLDAVSGLYVIIPIRGGGVYFSAYPGSASESQAIVGDPCADAGMDGASCTQSDSCQIYGCNAQWCGSTPPRESFLCIPDTLSSARRNCLCTCFNQRCLWIR